jgi:hypothetical protein
MCLTWYNYEEVLDESVHDGTYGLLPGFSTFSSSFKIEKLRYENPLGFFSLDDLTMDNPSIASGVSWSSLNQLIN